MRFLSIFGMLAFINTIFADSLIVIENNADLLSKYSIDKTSSYLTKQSIGSSIGSGPVGDLVSPDGNYFFVLNASSANIARFNMSDLRNNDFKRGSIVGQIGLDTWGGSFTPDGKGLLISNNAQNKYDYFSYNKSNGSLTKTKDVILKYCSGPFGTTFVPNTNVMYINCYNSNLIDKLTYSTASGTFNEEKTIVIGNGYGAKPRGIFLDDKNKKAYISSEGTGSIYVHNYTPTTGEIGGLITQINTNFGLLIGVKFDPFGNMIGIDRSSGTLNYYKSSSDGIYKDLVRVCHLGKITLGGITFDNHGHMYANTRGDNSVSLYNVSADRCPQMVQNITTTGTPVSIEIIPD